MRCAQCSYFQLLADQLDFSSFGVKIQKHLSMHEVFSIIFIPDVVGRDCKTVSTHLYVVGWDY